MICAYHELLSHVPADEPIDLLNVAFENPRKTQVRLDGNLGARSKREKQRQRKVADTNGADESPLYLVPDRITGLQEVDELQRLCPKRTWNFVCLAITSFVPSTKMTKGRDKCSLRGTVQLLALDNLSQCHVEQESQALRPVIEAVMWPSKTVMDLVRSVLFSKVDNVHRWMQSLAMALYFASRGDGRIRSNGISDTYRPYTSHARVLLNGLGSDELLGGYGRHRTAFTARGWKGVIEEVNGPNGEYLKIVLMPCSFN